MSEARNIALPELREIISDTEELIKGMGVLDAHGLARLARAGNKLFCDARGASPVPYKVLITLTEGTTGIRARCTCRAAQSRPFCKHAAALLVAWARAPEAFAVSDRAPVDENAQKKKSVKRGKVSAAALGKTGVEQVATLVRELAVAGVASVPEARIAQMLSLGENLRELKLRRLSGRTLSLADRLAESALDPATLDPLSYTSAVSDMLLTARKLDRHFEGEPLDPRHVEELIGKTWRKPDRTPVEQLELVEYAFLNKTTPDEFIIRESRFFDLRTGIHYSEKQILPGMIAKRTEPKKSYAGRVLVDAKGSIYPGFPPHRLDLTSAGSPRLLDARALETLIARAQENVGAALTAFQAHRRDIFAPERLPLAIRTETVLAAGRRAQIVDNEDRALYLPDDRALFDRLAIALEKTKLRALIGEATLHGALPTFFPSAAIVETERGPMMHSLMAGSSFAGTRKVKVEQKRNRGAAPWIEAARAAGASEAAIALGEIREELANLFVTGLATLNIRAATPIADRLRELGLGKQAELLDELAKKSDPAERLDSFVKIFSVLEIAVVRLIGSAHVDRKTLVEVPLHPSVYVAPRSDGGPPANRWEAAVELSRALIAASDEALKDWVWPAWADGSKTPFIAAALAPRGEAARALATAVLADPSSGKTTQHTAQRVLQAIAPTPAANASNTNASNANAPTPAANAPAPATNAPTPAANAPNAYTPNADAPQKAGRKPPTSIERLTAELLSAPRGADRKEAARELAETGAPAARAALRLSHLGDVSADVRGEALKALGKMMDPEVVETALELLAARHEHPAEAAAAVAALAECGDVRALAELRAAEAERFKPKLVKAAIRAIGGPES